MGELLSAVVEFVREGPPGLALLLAAGGAVVLGLVLARIAIAVLGQIARRTSRIADEAFGRHCRRPLALLLPLLLLRVLAEALSDRVPGAVEKAITVGVIVVIGWLLQRLVMVIEDSVFARLRLDVPDNLAARRLYTQLRVLRRIAGVAIVILTGGAVLFSFDSLRQLGAGLLTSAGIAGVVVGFAAQRTVGNLIAGFQVAFTQPIRTDDVVIVEGEWGRIEEITLTYVVVRIWDERRLVVPISYFIEKPFQNWTRVSAELLGTAYLWVDYRMPVDELRTELQRLVEQSEHWDGKLWRIHVTDASDRAFQVRALMSAADSAKAWELRCEVREGLLRYLQEHHPEALPRVRAELEDRGTDGSTDAGARDSDA